MRRNAWISKHSITLVVAGELDEGLNGSTMFSRLHVHLLRRFPLLILAGEALAPATSSLGNRPSPLSPHPIPTAGCNGTSFSLYSPLSFRLAIHKRGLCFPAIATMETGDGAPSSSYLSVLIHCPKDDAVSLLNVFIFSSFLFVLSGKNFFFVCPKTKLLMNKWWFSGCTLWSIAVLWCVFC